MIFDKRFSVIVLLLIHFCTGAYAYSSITSNTFEGNSQSKEQFIDYSKAQHHALEIPTLTVSTGEFTNTLCLEKDARFSLKLSANNLRGEGLLGATISLLYYNLSNLIIPGLGIDELLFPSHFHT